VAALLSWGIALFLPFAFFYMHQSMKLDYVWAGVCLLGAVYLHVSVLKVFPC
jgi:uncharacterized protein (DUF486 family)